MLAREDRLEVASVLVAVGDLDEAEIEVGACLAERPDDAEALSLLAKVKHIRGELSEAFACWARGRAGMPQSEAARMRLMSLLHLARDPERGAGEFLALGADHLWRKPASFMEIERVFQLFVRRQPDEARAACERLIHKYRALDPELYKLAVLAEALIAELAGDLEGARWVLERLGREHGYETDIDRALALARVYEQLGDRENLEKAANIGEYLAGALSSFESVTNLGRLAALYRALGREDEAELYDRLFLDAFRRRMHRPTFAQLTAAAARQYVPLSRLAAARVPATEADPGWERRQRGLGLALAGNRAAARALLAAGSEALDRKYLGDLVLAAGEEEAAAAHYLAALADDPDDLEVIGALLRLGAGPAGAAVAEHFRQPAHYARTRAALEAALRETPLAAACWRRIASFHLLLGEWAEASHSTAHAAALETAAARRGSAVGRVLSAAVYHFAGEGKGLIHEVWAERRPASPGRGGRLEEILGNVTLEMAAAVRNTFVSVREYALAKLPHQAGALLDYNYAYKVTKEDEPSSGPSAGLPSALAFLSVFLDRPVPQDLASSGVLVADAHDVLVVRPVAEVELKVRGAYNRDLRLLLLPAANRADLVDSPYVPRAVVGELVRFVSDLDGAVSLVFGEEIWLA